MNIKQTIASAAAAAALAFGLSTTSASAASYSYPWAAISLDMTLTYSTNTYTNMGSALKTVTFANSDLFKLLNSSSSATNAIFQVTGKTNIPSGSTILWNPDQETLLITNSAKKFSFPLEGSYTNATVTPDAATVNYNFGYLYLDYLVGDYARVKDSSDIKETDLANGYFYFNDQSQNETEVGLYFQCTLTWIYGPTKVDGQSAYAASVQLDSSGCGSDYCEVKGYDAIADSFSCTGSGNSTESLSDYVPFFYWW